MTPDAANKFASALNTSNKPTRVTVREALDNAGLELEQCLEGECPACCSDGCLVEPDGVCPDGFPSVLIEMGMI